MNMPATYLIFLAAGLGIVWAGLRLADDVYRLAAALAGAIFLIWGFALTPKQFQLPIEALVIVAVFPICVRCLKG